jgi:signal transduction histidine kinase
MASRSALAPASRPRLRTIRAALLRLIVATTVPATALVLLASVVHYRGERDGELRATAEAARDVATGFEGVVQDLVRTQYALGLSLVGERSAQRIQAELEAVHADHGALRALSLAGADGEILASTDRRLVGTSIQARDYFQVLAHGDPWAVSGLVHSLADGAPVFVVARAIDDHAGGRGVVVATIDPDRLAAFLAGRGRGRAVAIVDPAGLVVARDPPLPEPSWDARHRLRDDDLVRAAIAGREASGTYASPPDGTRRIGATAPVPSLGGWVAHASRPYSEAMVPVWRAVAPWAAAALTVAVLALVAAVRLSRRIAVPLEQLEAHAVDLARGEHAVAAVRGPIEVERVARALNAMSEALFARRGELEAAMRTAIEYGAELDAVFATAPVGLLHLEGFDRAPRLNGAARDMLGVTSTAPLLEYLRTVRVTHPERGALAPDALPISRALRGEAVRDELLRVDPLPDHPGRACWLSVSAAPVRGPEGEVRGAVASFVDVTAIRELQEERESLMQMVSHDLRTPLHVILLHGQLLQRSGGEVVARRAEAILASTARMQRLIQDMVDAARLEAGRLELHLEPVDLAAFLHGWKERLAGALAVDRVRISIAAEPPVVLADPARLEQIVVNLVTNALKYSVAESEVQVAVEQVAGRLELSVRDRGPGIATDELARIFDRYYRARGASRAEGLGLGLFITRKLVDAHGWEIRVESELGRGSVFTVAMPVGPPGARSSAA